MNIVLSNDLENYKFFNELLNDEVLSDEERKELIKAKVESELQTLPKLESMAYSINRNETEIEFLELRIKELKQKIKTMNSFMEWTKESIIEYMKAKNIDELKAETYTFKLTKKPASLNIVNPSLIPDKYKRTEIVIDYPKDPIKKALQAGETVEGVELVTDAVRLIIK